MASSNAPLPQSFISKKRKILQQLAVPASEYEDLSPKGSIDEGIRDLIDEINGIEGCVTTSSCAGRTSIFLEGKRNVEEESGAEINGGKESGEMETIAGVGGKGGGGRWLYVTHDPIPVEKHRGKLTELFSMRYRDDELARDPDERFIHFKFEPMILHVLTASLDHAQMVLSAALQAGFRESGAINLLSSKSESATPIVAVRSMGLSLESIIGYSIIESDYICNSQEGDLRTLVQLSNQRFEENSKRIERFRSLLKKLSGEDKTDEKRKRQNGEEWEDPQARRERKRAEGLARSQRLKNTGDGEPSKPTDEPPGLELLEHNT